MRRSFGAALTRLLRRLVPARLTNRYRPELHYMRGPGPQWRAKHQKEASAEQKAAFEKTAHKH